MSQTAGEVVEVTGVILDVVFENADTGYAVVRLRVRGEAVPVTVTGTMFGVSVGTRIRVDGRYREHPRFGKQLHVERYEEVRPSSRQGMVGYLASQFKGVGEKLAERIVETFGDRTYEVLDRDPSRIGEVPGVGKKKAKEIATQWGERRSIREASTFLIGYGVRPGTIARVFRHYGEDTVSLVKTNPYRLADEVSGIGFRTADRIAQSLGIPKDSIDRARAGLLYLLAEASGRGHTLLPEHDLLRRAGTLEIEESAARAALLDLDTQREVFREEDAPDADGPSLRPTGTLSEAPPRGDRWSRRGPGVYLPRLYADESAAAEILGDMAAHPLGLPNAEVAVDRAAKRSGLDLADGQRRALILALSNRVSVITGGPGVGKTTIVRLLLDILREAGADVGLAAPTGRAAKRLSEASGGEAKTVHRLLRYDPTIDSFQHYEDEPLEHEHLVIDECSMLDVPLAASLLRALDEGVGLTLVGDADQLPSVGPGDFLRAVCAAEGVAVSRLQQVFRQRDGSRIVAGAHAMLRGEVPEFDPAGAGGEFYFVERDRPDEVAELIRTIVAERIPNAYGLDPRTQVQVLTPMHKGAAGAENLNVVLGQALNPNPPASIERGGRRYRVFDRVVQIKNDYEKNVFNGDQGIIVAIDEKQGQVRIRFDDGEVSYTPEDLNLLLPAWATTVHRAQGGEHAAVVIALTTQHYPLLQRNLIYTAITRARQLCVIVGSRRALVQAIQTETTHDRYCWLEERLTRAIRAASAERPVS